MIFSAGTYESATTVLTDPRFSVEPPGGADPANHTLFRDGEPHRRLRAAVSRAFTARRIAELTPRVEGLAAACVEDMIARNPRAGRAATDPPPSADAATDPPPSADAVADPRPSADAVADLAAPLAAGVVGDLLGVDDTPTFRRIADGALMGDPADPAAGWGPFLEYAAELATARRGFLQATLHEAGLSRDELVGMVLALVGAGYVSTRNAIAVGVIHLSGRFADLPADAVEEVLRRGAGATGEPLPRWTTAEVRLDDDVLAPGTRVQVALGAAQRADRPHLAFGRGPHHCLGAALARLELRAAFDAVARGVPGLRLAVAEDAVPWVRGHVDAGPTSVPVTW